MQPPPEAKQDRFTPATRQVIANAKASVVKYRHSHITPEHILLGLLDNPEPATLKAFSAAKAKPAQIKLLVEHHLRAAEYDIPADQLSLSERAKRVVECAREEAQRAQTAQIGPEHLVIGLVRVKNTVAAAVLAAIDLTEDILRETLRK